VFKTFGEISQMEIVQQAAARQNWIDQGQSTNLMIHPKVPAKQVSELMIASWEMGLKSLYYQRSTNPAQDLVLDILSCSACEA
jgi:ribonucleoside-diphosphate reductase alpha chain